jgi:hypothetical protein
MEGTTLTCLETYSDAKKRTLVLAIRLQYIHCRVVWLLKGLSPWLSWKSAVVSEMHVARWVVWNVGSSIPVTYNGEARWGSNSNIWFNSTTHKSLHECPGFHVKGLLWTTSKYNPTCHLSIILWCRIKVTTTDFNNLIGGEQKFVRWIFLLDAKGQWSLKRLHELEKIPSGVTL